jgi:hypothetical protein
MQEVYSAASLTIAATVSPNGQRGCFRKLPIEQQAIEVPKLDNGGVSWSLSLRTKFDHSKLFASKGSSRYPLLRRGWAFQERVLSTRVLHFTEHELVWQCATATSCQCSTLVSSTPQYLSIYPSMTWTKKNLTGGSSDDVDTRWRMIVQEFSLLSLSHSQDRLPALEGLAKEFSAKKMDYLAGLWRDSLLQDLTWRATSPLQERPKKWRAPTWSWAAIDGSVTFELEKRPKDAGRPLCQIFRAECSQVLPSAFGQVSGGCLDLRGHIIESELHWREDLKWVFLGVRDSEGYVNLGRIAPDYLMKFDGNDWISDNKLGTPTRRKAEPVYCFPLASRNEGKQLEILILSRTNASLNEYRRIGIYLAWRAKNEDYVSKTITWVLENGSKEEQIRIV